MEDTAASDEIEYDTPIDLDEEESESNANSNTNSESNTNTAAPTTAPTTIAEAITAVTTALTGAVTGAIAEAPQAPKYKKPVIKSKIPESPSDPKTIDEWIKLREEQKSKWAVRQHRYTTDGDLIIDPATPEEREVRIPITPFVPAKQQAIHDYFKKRYGEDIKTAEEDYTATKRELQRIMLEYKAGRQTLQDVIGANEAVHEAECKLTMKVKAPRFIAHDEDVILRDLTFNIYDVSKIEDLDRAEYNTFPEQAFWTTKADADAEVTVEAATTEEAKSAPVEQSGGKKELSMSAIMAIQAQKARGRAY